MSRILVTEDRSQTTSLVECWVSARGNLCWKFNGNVYVKMKNGFTIMTPENQKNWVPSDCHTKASFVKVRIHEVRTPSNPQIRSEQIPLSLN